MPTFHADVKPLGVGAGVHFGGKNVGDGIKAAATVAHGVADRLNFEARMAERMNAFTRRELDWSFQSNLAALEISQIFKQLRAAQIREAIAEMELKSHRQQIKHTEEIEQFLNGEGREQNGKKTNKSLYAWMKREIKGLYAQCFQFAFDIAKKTERALQQELGNTGLTYLQDGYFTGQEGLLAGEKLYFNLKRMEMAYHDLKEREYELTKQISLLQMDPLALIQLRTTGTCKIKLKEEFFDWDGPGHYFRRIKSVALSIPCIVGPYASVNCRLTLLNSSIRKEKEVAESYTRKLNAEDARFNDYSGGTHHIVTSSAQNDSGMFETNLHDERYLPFEGFGVISEWQLDLPANPSNNDPCQFDYNTISDVILQLRYTAREGGDGLSRQAKANIRSWIRNEEHSIRLFSLRHDFPNEWAKFQNAVPDNNQQVQMALKLRAEHFPFWTQGRLNGIQQLAMLARSPESTLTVFDNTGAANNLEVTVYGKLLYGELNRNALPSTPFNDYTFFFEGDKNKILEDFWIAVKYNCR